MKDQDTKKRKVNSFEVIPQDSITEISLNADEDFVGRLEITDQSHDTLALIREINFTFAKSDIRSDIEIRILIKKAIKITLFVRVKAPRGIKNVSSKLNMKALMLNSEASITFVPVLEIDEIDVSVDHKSSIGTPEREWLNYMETRGFGYDNAIELISKAFLD